MERIVKGGGPLAGMVKKVYLEATPPAGTSLWSMMWDEVMVASLIDPSVIKKSETMWLDVGTSHGPKYGDTVVWKKPEGMPKFFLPYSGPTGPDVAKWEGHLKAPAWLHPAEVQLEMDEEKFDDLFVRIMTE
jgi:inosine-uridine nucleoside N-ribohydrolase